MNSSALTFLDDLESYLDDAQHEAGVIALRAQDDFETTCKLVGALHGIRDNMETVRRILEAASATTAATPAPAPRVQPSEVFDRTGSRKKRRAAK